MSFFSLAFSKVVSSFSSISFLQDSCLSYSSCCCIFSSAIILSIASFTFSKPSSCTPTARVAKCQAPAQPFWCLATARSCDAARARCCSVRPVLLICTKLSVFERRSRASSSVRILIASAIACTSSVRVLLRSAYSVSAVAQRSFRSIRNFSSALRASRESAKSTFACATFWFVAANWACFSSMDLALACSSPSLADLRCWNASSACISAFCDWARFFWNVSCICFRIPRMEELLAL
mmetsp:Transcript_82465/g.191576  ORF Transcript_82465/g.191576 Transcript_82465/m.191576 type:complete len:237 (-) Transcript_82465:767-1477(-)